MNKVLIVGTSGLAREILNWSDGILAIDGFIDITKESHSKFELPGKFYFENEISADFLGTKKVILAVGDPFLKEKLFLKYQNFGFDFYSFISPLSTIAKSVKIGKGVIICPNCIVGANALIDDFVLLNYLSGIGHDSVIEKFCQINPGVQIGGGVRIGQRTLVGSGSTIIHGVNIGEECRLGSGSVIFNKVNDGTTVIGNPAKKIF